MILIRENKWLVDFGGDKPFSYLVFPMIPVHVDFILVGFVCYGYSRLGCTQDVCSVPGLEVGRLWEGFLELGWLEHCM